MGWSTTRWGPAPSVPFWSFGCRHLLLLPNGRMIRHLLPDRSAPPRRGRRGGRRGRRDAAELADADLDLPLVVDRHDAAHHTAIGAVLGTADLVLVLHHGIVGAVISLLGDGGRRSSSGSTCNTSRRQRGRILSNLSGSARPGLGSTATAVVIVADALSPRPSAGTPSTVRRCYTSCTSSHRRRGRGRLGDHRPVPPDRPMTFLHPLLFVAVLADHGRRHRRGRGGGAPSALVVALAGARVAGVGAGVPAGRGEAKPNRVALMGLATEAADDDAALAIR